MDSDKVQASNTPEGMNLTEFLESTPPGRMAVITDTLLRTTVGDYRIKLPPLHLHCTSEECNGLRFFAPSHSSMLNVCSAEVVGAIFQFLYYTCRNCSRRQRVFSVWAKLTPDQQFAEIYKIGEIPPFGPPTPARLIALAGRDRELFLKGRRAENQALGIAAFAYYRRVVENQKAKILGEILRVATRVNAEPSLIEELKAAQAENQFAKSVEMIKHGLPPVLLIQGHNPLTLLHGALSEGIHEKSDEDCLELATSIRVVLTELAERIAQALKDDAELNTAMSKLLQIHTRRQAPRSESC